jgi:hypothetical protein
MWEMIAPLAVALAILGLFGAVLWGSLSRSKKEVARWARENGFELGRCRWRWRGGELLLSFRVVDQGGRAGQAWARCGGSMIGMLSRRVDVRMPHNVPKVGGSEHRRSSSPPQ